ncbi:MAG TPA: IS66 family transposase [Ktedonobacteraceae bacterium]|nr:IS66 family transposase [Ktedonobacteraceae bacterium]
MTTDEELAQLQSDNRILYDALVRTEDELHRAHQANEDLREGLKQALIAIGAQQERVQALEEVITAQQERITTLERQQAKDSHNSSLPPASDRFVRPAKSLRKKSGKQAGGQPGHPGHHLRPVEMPDEVLIHPVVACSHCQHDLRDEHARIAERRQVIDLPVKRLWVVEHQVEEKQCSCCGSVTRAGFPTEVCAPAQYGRGVQALSTYLVAFQAVPYDRTSQLLQDLFGVQLSAGSIAHFVCRCHQQLAIFEATLKAALIKARVLHQDETGLRVGKSGWWVHVCSTEKLTHYGAHKSRGRDGMDAIGIAPQLTGTSVHDGLRSYHGYQFTEAFCNVHHLRDLTFIEEELKQDWAKDMKTLLLEMKTVVEEARARGQPQLETSVLAPLLTRYDQLVRAGYQINPQVRKAEKSDQYKRVPGRPRQSPARNLLDRFSVRKWDVLRFLLDFTVPFDNNQAERDLRMIKVQQKVSGCFRTEEGIGRFCRIRSYLSTLRKQGIALLSALESTLSGHPVLPAFPDPSE